jgi:hypothetical protein
MDIKKELQEFNKRWSVTDDISYEQEFKKFKNRILNIFIDIDNHVQKEGIAQFCQILGVAEKWEHESYGNRSWSRNIINALEEENEEKKFYRLLQIISLLPIKTAREYRTGKVTHSRQKILHKLAEAIELSKVNLAMDIKSGGVMFRPKGEERLDEVLVNEVLSFLNPESQNHFADALNAYSTFSKKSALKSAESLRRSLEEFLRHKLRNQQGLDKNIHELCKKLKEKHGDVAIRNVIFRTFSLIDQYFNENSKHKDGDIDQAENEFLIYQTGLLMRYIDKNI